MPTLGDIGNLKCYWVARQHPGPSPLALSLRMSAKVLHSHSSLSIEGKPKIVCVHTHPEGRKGRVCVLIYTQRATRQGGPVSFRVIVLVFAATQHSPIHILHSPYRQHRMNGCGHVLTKLGRKRCCCDLFASHLFCYFVEMGSHSSPSVLDLTV